MTLRLGIDLGASWLRLCLARDGHELWIKKSPALGWRRLPGALRALRRSKLMPHVDLLMVGGTRLGDRKDRELLRQMLSKLASRVKICPDFEIAHSAAFASRPGVILVASTGSVAFARDENGKTRRAGGLGPLFGDEGSGFWLGRQAVRDERLRRTLRLPAPLDLAHAEDPIRATAALAAKILRASPRLLREASNHIAGLAREVIGPLKFSGPVPIALHGSMFQNKNFKAAVLRRLGRGWRPVTARVCAERAAAGL